MFRRGFAVRDHDTVRLCEQRKYANSGDKRVGHELIWTLYNKNGIRMGREAITKTVNVEGRIALRIGILHP